MTEKEKINMRTNLRREIEDIQSATSEKENQIKQINS